MSDILKNDQHIEQIDFSDKLCGREGEKPLLKVLLILPQSMPRVFAQQHLGKNVKLKVWEESQFF